MILDMLRTPEAQADPHHWGATRLAHSFLGVGFTALLPWWVVVGVYALWEVVQWRFYEAEITDCIIDWLAVALGSGVAVMLSQEQAAWVPLAMLLFLLIAGMRARR